MKVYVLSERSYHEPKLQKPSDLKGVKQIGSAKFGPKCKCPVFVKDGYIYVKQRDWFSPSLPLHEAKDRGLISSINKKFIYDDNFGSVVLRNEAWLIIDGIDKIREDALRSNMVNEMIISLADGIGFDWTEIYHSDWVIFFEDIIDIVRGNDESILH